MTTTTTPKSTHKAEVVPVKLELHSNATSLSVVRVFGYSVVVRTIDWVGRDSGVYIVPDSVVDITRPEFSFLPKPRVTVKKLRGVVSQGLLVPTPPGFKIGDDAAEFLGVTRYEPPVKFGMETDNEAGPELSIPKYDVDSANRYAEVVLVVGEPLYICEKIHGSSGRWLWHQDRMWAGARRDWRKEDPRSLWWMAMNNCPWITEWCKAHPGLVLYGEVFGPVQDLKYGRTKPDVRIFDVYDPLTQKFWDLGDVLTDQLLQVPSWGRLKEGEWNFQNLEELATKNFKKSLLCQEQVAEGVVIRPLKERFHDHLGRVVLKYINNEYMESH